MKRLSRFKRAFTLVEMIVTMAVFLVSGALIFDLLRLGVNLYSKNLAVNISHQQARSALDRLSKDINAAISVPTLTDATLQPVANAYGFAPGLTFLKQASPILQVKRDAAANQNVIRIQAGSFVPKVGERLIIPAYQIEENITGVNLLSGGKVDLTLADNLTDPVTGSSDNIVAFVADLVGYAVVNSELRYFPNAATTSSYSVISYNMTNDTPFGVPTASD